MPIPLLKGFECLDQEPLDQWTPDSAEEVCYHLCLHIGLPGQAGADDFLVQIVTPQAVNRRNLGGSLPKHHLVVNPYSWENVLQHIGQLLGRCQGDSWESISGQLAQHFDWEFEA